MSAPERVYDAERSKELSRDDVMVSVRVSTTDDAETIVVSRNDGRGGWRQGMTRKATPADVDLVLEILDELLASNPSPECVSCGKRGQLG